MSVDTAGVPTRTAPRIAIVHERFTEMAGSEAVVQQLARQWPSATVHVPVARRDVLPDDLRDRVRDTPLSHLLRGSTYAHLLPLLPVAMARMHLPPADLVITSHHAFAQQVVHATSTPVVSYVHSPARWVWEPTMRAGEVGGRVGRAGLAAFAAAYRGADRSAAQRVHTLVANSAEVAGRIRRWWGREAVVVHPPVDTERYTVDPRVPREAFFLLAGRLVAYKRPDLAVRAAARAGVRLVVAGDGRGRADLERAAGPGTTFLGRVSDDELRDLYRRCRALLMPGVEDFGIVPVEAQACGAPVIAQAAGGALDSVLPGTTGVLVAGTDAAEWAEALTGFEAGAYDPAAVRRHAEGFSRALFQQRMAGVVDGVLRDQPVS